MKLILICIICLCQICWSSISSNAQIVPAPAINGAIASPSNYNMSGNSGYSNIGSEINYTGTKQITIPIYNSTVSGYNLPISISYDGSGVKLKDVATSVGLKWQLNAGGKISRSVQDIPDEGTILKRSRLMLYYLDNIDIDDKIDNINNQNNETNATRINEVYDNYDLEPDIFSYSINGVSGSFVLDNNAVVRHLEYSNNIVEVNVQDNGYNNPFSIIGFKITDENGIIYILDVVGKFVIDSYGWGAYSTATHYQNYNVSKVEFNSEWYLSKIILPNSEEIDFQYEDENYLLPNIDSKWGKGCNTSYGNCDSFFGSGNPGSIIVSKDSIYGKRISLIESSIHKIEFISQQTPRQDLSNTYALHNIVIIDKINSNDIVKKFQFNFYYTNPNANDIHEKRLMLCSIDELHISNNQTSNRNIYSFEYNMDYSMPSRLSEEYDFWGYYNGQSLSFSFPTLYVYPDENGIDKYRIYPKANYTGTTFILDGANRLPDSEKILTYSIKSIGNVTGGKTLLEFEPNEFFYDGENRLGSGLRIKKVIQNDGISNDNNIVTLYEYTKSNNVNESSGWLINLPQYAIPNNTHPYGGTLQNPTIQCSNFDDLDEEYYTYFLMRLSDPYFNSSDITQGYSEITEKHLDGSKIVRRYSMPGTLEQEGDDELNVNCFLEKDGYCDGLFERYYTSICASLESFNLMGSTIYEPDLKGHDNNVNKTIPFNIPINYLWNRGLLLDVHYFDEEEYLVQKKVFEYENISKENTPQYIKGLRVKEMDNWRLDPMSHSSQNNFVGNAFTGLYYFSKYNVITNVSKVKTKEIITNYEKNSTLSQTFSTTFTYGFFHKNPLRISITDSKGNKRITENLFSFDIRDVYDNTYPSTAFNSFDRNNINVLIRELQLILPVGGNEELVVSSIISLFESDVVDQVNNIFSYPKPKEIKSLNVTNPFPKSQLTDNFSGQNFALDSRYKLIKTFEAFDQRNNLLELAERPGKSSSIYGYNKSRKIAEVFNASYDEIAYSSFELAGEIGNWEFDVNYTNPQIENVSNAPTGKSCFNLDESTLSKYNLYANTYIVSYWSTNGQYNLTFPNQVTQSVIEGVTVNGWTYYEHELSGVQHLTINSNHTIGTPSYIDELRLFPKNSMMTTYTYFPLIGISSICDFGNNIINYEYDGFGELISKKDIQGNIIESFIRTYKGATNNCSN